MATSSSGLESTYKELKHIDCPASLAEIHSLESTYKELKLSTARLSPDAFCV